MTDEYKLQRDVSRGARAKALLENELLTESFKALEETYIKAWRETAKEDFKGRENLFIAINQIGDVQQHLLSVISDGSLAEANLRSLAKRHKRYA